MSSVLDSRSRPLRDLRISVTDRCNFRCTYCMPKEIFGRDFAFLPARASCSPSKRSRAWPERSPREGVSKIRLTGGEPLLRRDLERLVAMLADIDGITDVALTTNGSALAAKAQHAQGRRPDARDRQPRRARRRDVRRDERRRLPRRACARRDRRRRRGRAHAGEGQHGRQARRQRPRDHRDGRALPRQRPHPAVHRVHGRRHHQRLADGRRRARRPRSPRRSTRDWPLEPLEPNYPGEVASRYRYRDGARRDRRSSRRSRSRSAAPAPERAYRPTASSTPVCSPRTATTSARCCAAAQPTSSSPHEYSSIWGQRADRYSELRTRPNPATHKDRDVLHRRLSTSPALGSGGGAAAGPQGPAAGDREDDGPGVASMTASALPPCDRSTCSRRAALVGPRRGDPGQFMAATARDTVNRRRILVLPAGGGAGRR